jgi:hypothetical protein
MCTDVVQHSSRNGRVSTHLSISAAFLVVPWCDMAFGRPVVSQAHALSGGDTTAMRPFSSWMCIKVARQLIVEGGCRTAGLFKPSDGSPNLCHAADCGCAVRAATRVASFGLDMSVCASVTPRPLRVMLYERGRSSGLWGRMEDVVKQCWFC